MALPVILVDSATGSDTAGSGAGPGTAITGSAGVSAGDGLTVTLDGSPDLSGVATDGSAVFFFNDATAGNRNFVKITAVNNSTKVITVANALGFTLTKAWAIGGKRATIFGTTSVKLLENNSSTGDARAGWIIEMQSAYAETQTGTQNIRCVGDATSGPVILRGVAGAGTLPVITANFNNYGFVVQAAAVNFVFKDFEYRNSSGTKTAAKAFRCFSGGVKIEGIRLDHSGGSNNWLTACYLEAGGNHVLGCTIKTTGTAIEIVSSDGHDIRWNYIHDCGAAAITATGDLLSCEICDNIIYNTTGVGISLTGGTSTTVNRRVNIERNTIDKSSSDGILIGGSTSMVENSCIINNILSNNGGYGLNFNSASVSLAFFEYYHPTIRNNDTYLNTSGAYGVNGTAYSISTATFVGTDPGLDPQFTNAAGGDFSIGTNLKAKGFPVGGSLYVGTYSTTYSYVDIGAAQRQEYGPRARYVMGGF